MPVALPAGAAPHWAVDDAGALQSPQEGTPWFVWTGETSCLGAADAAAGLPRRPGEVAV